jgi:hypothetical protein
MQYEKRGTICTLLARHSDSTPASLPMRRHNAESIVVVCVVSLLLLRPASGRRSARCLQSPFCWCPMSVTKSSSEVVHLTCFKVVPSPHRNFTAVEFALIFEPSLLRLLASRLARVAPTEVIKLPEGVRRKDEIPDRE